MSERFSKRLVLEALGRRLAARATEFKRYAGREIDPDNGYAQCRGRSMEAAVAYGEWREVAITESGMMAGEL